MTMPAQAMIAILPCKDLDLSERFYGRLGFVRDVMDIWPSRSHADYRIMSDGRGARLHLVQATEGWLTPGRNPFGLYLYAEDVDQLANSFAAEMIESDKKPEHKPWGMYEFSVSDPDETLVRVGRPSRLRHQR
jgi:hypothetical protein